MENQSLNNFIENIITHDDINEQINFMKIYPVLQSNKTILEYWIEIYKNTSLSDQQRINIYNFLYNAITKHYLDIDSIQFLILMKSLSINDRMTKYIEIINFIVDRFQQMPVKIPVRTPKCEIRSIIEIKTSHFVNTINKYYLDIFKKINSHELIFKCIKKNYQSQGINELSNLFNKLTDLVRIEILIISRDDSQRIKIIKKFLRIAKSFLKSNNYEALFAIMAGLGSLPIQRIKNLWNPKKNIPFYLMN